MGKAISKLTASTSSSNGRPSCSQLHSESGDLTSSPTLVIPHAGKGAFGILLIDVPFLLDLNMAGGLSKHRLHRVRASAIEALEFSALRILSFVSDVGVLSSNWPRPPRKACHGSKGMCRNDGGKPISPQDPMGSALGIWILEVGPVNPNVAPGHRLSLPGSPAIQVQKLPRF